MTPISPAAILRNGLRVLAPVSLVLTIYLYLYPLFNTCAFPLPQADGADTGLAAFLETAALHSPFLPTPVNNGEPAANASRADDSGNDHKNAQIRPLPSRLAPFRLLALGDPQLEGDTSIPTTYLGYFPHFWTLLSHLTFRSDHPSLRQRVRQSLHDVVDLYLEDVPNTIESLRKYVDLFGNDFYLAHIFRTLHWWTKPTHVSVLGDLVGSQWLEDYEFYRRSERYWARVFRGGERVPDHVARGPDEDRKSAGVLHRHATNNDDDGEAAAWTRRIINVAGNHDIGYAGDISQERLNRFERAFGKANYELRFELPETSVDVGSHDAGANVDVETQEQQEEQQQPPSPELRIVVVNDMNLDTPALSSELQDATYRFINGIIGASAPVERRDHFTLVLTHVPLYKPPGVCVDAPFFAFHEHDGTLREQNQLSVDASKGFLEGIYGMSGNPDSPASGTGRPGVILNGHDHEGCDTWHFINQTSPKKVADRRWEVMRWGQAHGGGPVGRAGHPGIREITVRSMMGDFGGNAGLLSVWFDYETRLWKFEYATCPLGKQHFWWVVHILDLITVLATVVYGVMVFFGGAVVETKGHVVVDLKAEEVTSRTASHLAANGDAKKTEGR